MLRISGFLFPYVFCKRAKHFILNIEENSCGNFSVVEKNVHLHIFLCPAERMILFAHQELIYDDVYFDSYILLQTKNAQNQSEWKVELRLYIEA